VLVLAPGDVESYLSLERVLVQEAKLEDAIRTLEKLVVVDPKRAREIYQRMAQYALQSYRDDDAIKYAARAVELNPEDAEGHRHLAEMYRSRQDTERAIGEFRASIAKNDREYVVYFELADLLLSKGETDEADRLFRRVIRGAPDEELVARAARLSMQINLGKGTLEALEQDLLPLAIGNPQRTIYRRLLVEIYESLTFGLVQRIRHATGADVTQARAALARIGQRAVKPLLDALADNDAGQQRVAIDVLGYAENKNAAPALFSFATGPAETPLRVEAMIACGSLKAADLLPRYEAFLFPTDDENGGDVPRADAVAVAASWGVARMADKRALPLLRALSRRGSPEMRAVAVLGLALLHDRGSVPEVAQIAKATDAGNVARAAAAYALGELGADGEVATLIAMAEGTDALPRQMALIALARLGATRSDLPGGRAALAAMTDSVFAGGDPKAGRSRTNALAIQRAASRALMLLASGKNGATRAVAPPLAAPDGALDIESELEHLVPDGFSSKERALGLTTFGEAIQRSAVAAMETSSDGARAVLDALGEGPGTLEPFVGAHDDEEAAHAKAREIGRALEPNILGLARHPDPMVRMKAVVLLAASTSDAAASEVVRATSDASEAVQRVAFGAIGTQRTAEAVQAVTQALLHHENWAMRVLAARALGRLGVAGGGEEVARALRNSATTDDYALVREAALTSLASFDAVGSRELAERMAANDPEPRLRDAARGIAQGAKH
jgi:HEAT repeat protein